MDKAALKTWYLA